MRLIDGLFGPAMLLPLVLLPVAMWSFLKVKQPGWRHKASMIFAAMVCISPAMPMDIENPFLSLWGITYVPGFLGVFACLAIPPWKDKGWHGFACRLFGVMLAWLVYWLLKATQVSL